MNVQIIEFDARYAREIRALARAAMESAGILPKTIDLYLEDDFDYETIGEKYQGRSQFWLALSGRKVVGTIAMAEVDKTIVRLRRMFVLPDFQGESIGQQLFDVALKFAQDKKYKKIKLKMRKLEETRDLFN